MPNKKSSIGLGAGNPFPRLHQHLRPNPCAYQQSNPHPYPYPYPHAHPYPHPYPYPQPDPHIPMHIHTHTIPHPIHQQTRTHTHTPTLTLTSTPTSIPIPIPITTPTAISAPIPYPSCTTGREDDKGMREVANVAYVFFAFSEHSPTAAKVSPQQGRVPFWHKARAIQLSSRQVYPSQREGDAGGCRHGSFNQPQGGGYADDPERGHRMAKGLPQAEVRVAQSGGGMLRLSLWPARSPQFPTRPPVAVAWSPVQPHSAPLHTRPQCQPPISCTLLLLSAGLRFVLRARNFHLECQKKSSLNFRPPVTQLILRS